MATVQQLMSLTGRVSVVTGGAKGLGRQMATALAEAGSDLVICGRNIEPCEEAAQELEKIGVKVLPVRCDIASAEDITAMRDRTLSTISAAPTCWSTMPAAPGSRRRRRCRSTAGSR